MRAIALRWQRRTSRERLAESESDKEIYLRFAVSINERLNSGIDQIMTAREILRGNSPARLRMASGSPSGRPRRSRSNSMRSSR